MKALLLLVCPLVLTIVSGERPTTLLSTTSRRLVTSTARHRPITTAFVQHATQSSPVARTLQKGLSKTAKTESLFSSMKSSTTTRRNTRLYMIGKEFMKLPKNPLSTLRKQTYKVSHPHPLTPEQRQKIREEIEQDENNDFLFVEMKPKVLVHERDFFRQSIRIAAWDQYVLVSILCTSISYGALDGFTLNADHEGVFFYEVILKNTIQFIAGLAVLSGLYSTMVFAICILYGKSALGLERDIQYDAFLNETGEIRVMAFRAFSSALAFFAILVVLVLSEDLPLIMNFPLGSIMVGALYIGFRDWKKLVDAAADIFDDYDEDF